MPDPAPALRLLTRWCWFALALVLLYGAIRATFFSGVPLIRIEYVLKQVVETYPAPKSCPF
jgi:hypothetical protein